MDDLDPHDDTSADYEQLETELLAQDQDAARAKTVDIDDATANNVVSGLLDAGVVTPVPEDRVLVHEPSDTAFDSTIQLALFHRGWTAAREATAQGE